VLASLQQNQFHITVPEDVAARARLAIERMVSIGATPQPAGAGVDPGE
jgi:quinolinate synthase